LNKRKVSKWNRTEVQWNKIPMHQDITCTFKNIPDLSINANKSFTKNIILLNNPLSSPFFIFLIKMDYLLGFFFFFKEWAWVSAISLYVKTHQNHQGPGRYWSNQQNMDEEMLTLGKWEWLLQTSFVVRGFLHESLWG